MTNKSRQTHKAICPVCGKSELDEQIYERCPVCGWYGDSCQRNHPDWTGENNITLVQARERYAQRSTH